MLHRYLCVVSGTLITKYMRQLDRNDAKSVKASIYANRNLCYHLDERHKRFEDGYSKITDRMAWAHRVAAFVEYKLDPLTKEVSGHLMAPMCADLA